MARPRLWTTQAPFYEAPVALLDERGEHLLTRRETRTDAPNYFVRKVAGDAAQALTSLMDQSERFYAALKGNGATVRYVVLPNEPHGYRGRESSMHVLWEMASLLDKYVKSKTPAVASAQ